MSLLEKPESKEPGTDPRSAPEFLRGLSSESFRQAPSLVSLGVPPSPQGRGVGFSTFYFPLPWGEGSQRRRAGEGSFSCFGVPRIDMSECIEGFAPQRTRRELAQQSTGGINSKRC